MAGVEVRRLRRDDDRRSFVSGDPDLDRFFWRYAGQNQFRHHLGTTYIAVAGSQILGFATVSAAQLEIHELPGGSQRRLPQYPLPALRLARLATAESARGEGLGRMLLRYVLALAWTMADQVGCVGVVVDAKPDAATFYERLGFEELEIEAGYLGDRPRPVPLFLELEAIPRP